MLRFVGVCQICSIYSVGLHHALFSCFSFFFKNTLYFLSTASASSASSVLCTFSGLKCHVVGPSWESFYKSNSEASKKYLVFHGQLSTEMMGELLVSNLSNYVALKQCSNFVDFCFCFYLHVSSSPSLRAWSSRTVL